MAWTVVTAHPKARVKTAKPGHSTALLKASAAPLPRGSPSPAGRAPGTFLLVARGTSHLCVRVCTALGTTVWKGPDASS